MNHWKIVPEDLTSLVATILAGNLLAKRVDHQSDGDIRYWGVDVSQSIVLQRLKNFGETCFFEITGKLPVLSFVMVNHIDCTKCPNGSGGGWHRDSLRPQYKAFAYLTDVEKVYQGAFCFIPASNSFGFRLVSMLYRVVSGGNRYNDETMNMILNAGFSRYAVLLKSGIPFFVNTSLIHRGLPISEGRRIMAAVYMYEDIPAELAFLVPPPLQ